MQHTHKLNIAGDLIQRTDLIHYLGAWLDAGLTYKHHITIEVSTSHDELHVHKVHKTSFWTLTPWPAYA